MVIAHRGEPHQFRENTLPALRAAMELGADVLAIDLGLTGDGQVMVVHHDALERLWGYPRALASMTLTDIAMLGESALRIPTLLEVLAEFARPGGPPLMLNVATVEIALAADDIVRVYGLVDRTLYAGASDAMRAIRARRTAAHLTLTWHDRGLPPAELWESVQPRWYNSYYPLLTPELVAELHRCGYGVLAWTVSEPSDMLKLLQMGVDGIITDRPGELASLTRQRR